MLLSIPEILPPEQVALCRQELSTAEWVDGRVTAGHQGARVKRNAQVPQHHPVARRLSDMILDELDRSSRFIAAALPLRILPPTFNRYEAGETFGVHIDGAIRQVPGTGWRVRTDLSATLFLSSPDDYDGGELTVQDAYGTHQVKLPAGDLVLYPAGSLHCVAPVTRGVRLAAFFWVQSMVRDDAHRTMLYDLDTAIQHLSAGQPDHPGWVQLTGVYHNLLRCWAET